MDDGRVYFVRDRRRWLGNLFLLFIFSCQWIYGFIITLSVAFAGAHFGQSVPLSPGIEIDFSTRAAALRTGFLFAVICVSWFGTYSFLFGYRWGYYYTWALGIFLLAVGLYLHWTDYGAFEDFVGDGSLRRTAGLVVAVLAGATLVLLPLPLLRRRFFDN